MPESHWLAVLPNEWTQMDAPRRESAGLLANKYPVSWGTARRKETSSSLPVTCDTNMRNLARCDERYHAVHDQVCLRNWAAKLADLDAISGTQDHSSVDSATFEASRRMVSNDLCACYIKFGSATYLFLPESKCRLRWCRARTLRWMSWRMSK